MGDLCGGEHSLVHGTFCSLVQGTFHSLAHAHALHHRHHRHHHHHHHHHHPHPSKLSCTSITFILVTPFLLGFIMFYTTVLWRKMFKTGPLSASVLFVCGLVSGRTDLHASGYQPYLLMFDLFLGFHSIGCPVPETWYMSSRRLRPATGLHLNLCWRKAGTGIMSDPNSSSLSLSSLSMHVTGGSSGTPKSRGLCQEQNKF